MKPIYIFFLIAMAFILLVLLVAEPQIVEPKEPQKKERLELVQEIVLGNFQYQIIKIDSHEYLSNYHGGIFKLR